MDFGKSAYMRVEELERRLDLLGSGGRERGKCLSVEPDREIKLARGLDLGTVSGGGVVTLTVKVTAQVYVCGEIYFLAGGKRAAKSEFPLLGAGETVFLASLMVTEPTGISLSCDKNFYGLVRRVEITAYGADADLNPQSAGGFGADGNGVSTGVVNINNDRLYFMQFDESGNKTIETELGGATAADIACLSDGYISAYRDGFGGLWLAEISKDGKAVREYFTGRECDSVAITVFDGFCMFAYTFNGKLYFAYNFVGFCREITDFVGFRGEVTDFVGFCGFSTADVDFSRFSGDIEVPCAFSADSVGFVKGCGKPMLIIGSGSKSFLKTTDDELCAGFGVDIGVSFTAEEIQ